MSFDPFEGISFELPFIPASKKNSVVIKRGRGGRHYPAKSDQVSADESEIYLRALTVLSRRGWDRPLFDDLAALRAELVLCPRLESVRVHVREVARLTERPKRDAANVPASVLDAMQRVIYRDDCQVTELEIVTDLAS